MKKPEMILFDYGQTLVNEERFNGVRGAQEVLKYATVNKYQRTAEQIQKEADAVNFELGRFDPERRHLFQVEVPNSMFNSYLYESQGIELPLTSEQIDKIFWDAAAPGKATDGICEFLDFLKREGIRTGVISNISYAGIVVKERINNMLPGNDFEFIIPSSEYIFRKPNRRIFDLALRKARLRPEDVWYIGDQYDCDVEGARNAGMFPVWYLGASDVASGEREDVLTIRDWGELQNLISAGNFYIS